MRHPSPAAIDTPRPMDPRTGRLDVSSGDSRVYDETPLWGAWCVHFREPSPAGLQRRYPGAGTTTQQSPSVHLPRGWIPPECATLLFMKYPDYVRLAPLPQVFRHPPCCESSRGDTICLSDPMEPPDCRDLHTTGAALYCLAHCSGTECGQPRGQRQCIPCCVFLQGSRRLWRVEAGTRPNSFG